MESLCCIPDANITLDIDYTSIKKRISSLEHNLYLKVPQCDCTQSTSTQSIWNLYLSCKDTFNNKLWLENDEKFCQGMNLLVTTFKVPFALKP